MSKIGFSFAFIATFQAALYLCLREKHSSIMFGTLVTCSIANVACIIAASVLRFRHSGKVCSGDYLLGPFEDHFDNPPAGFTIYEGLFLYIYVVLGYVQYGMLLLILVPCYYFGGKSEE